MRTVFIRVAVSVGITLAVYVLSFWLICLHNIPSGYRFMQSMGVSGDMLDKVYYPMFRLTLLLFGENSYGH